VIKKTLDHFLLAPDEMSTRVVSGKVRESFKGGVRVGFDEGRVPNQGNAFQFSRSIPAGIEVAAI
jgi:hypothetical protein